MRNVVDLPAPLGPRNPVHDARLHVEGQSVTAIFSP
jgi:hypothetical protein